MNYFGRFFSWRLSFHLSLQFKEGFFSWSLASKTNVLSFVLVLAMVLVTFFVLVVGVTTSGIVVVDNAGRLPWQQGPRESLLVTVVVLGTLWHNDDNDAAGGWSCFYSTNTWTCSKTAMEIIPIITAVTESYFDNLNTLVSMALHIGDNDNDIDYDNDIENNIPAPPALDLSLPS